MSEQNINIRGAREHNLDNIYLQIPRDEFIVITGVSGSGKSSLAFDTIYAEGQRRYVESLSAYARQFLELMQKPDVDGIDGLSPAISIEQKTASRNLRSTVGTVTEIYDYLRLMFARIGTAYSPTTGLPVESQTVSQMVDRIMHMKKNMRFYVIAPIVRGRKGEYKKEIQELQKQGYQRLRVDQILYDIEDVPPLKKTYKHDIEVIVDRLILKENIEERLADSLETALRLAGGIAVIEDAENNEKIIFSEQFVCPVSGFTIEEIEPKLFSFNNPFGACPSCDGLGTEVYFDIDLIVTKPDAPLRDAIGLWSNSSSTYLFQTIESLANYYNFNISDPFSSLSEKIQNIILNGSGDTVIPIVYSNKNSVYKTKRKFEGIIPNLARRWKETNSNQVREDLAKYQSQKICHHCKGWRLKEEALAVKINHAHIGEVSALSIRRFSAWIKEVETILTKKQITIARPILREIKERIEFLNNIGLGYLTLSRASRTLSGGESQRIRLASQIGSGLVGVLYVLDEPSIGLHQRDNNRLLKTLYRLRDLGNTVIVVEHDEEAIRNADHVIDIGPGAGIHGGKIVAQGDINSIMETPESITGDFLSGKRSISVPEKRRKGNGKTLSLYKASGNNLKNIDVHFPLEKFICITGVSGSGKSTLVIETLYRSIARHLYGAKESVASLKSIKGIEQIDKVIDVDQSPIGRTPRSNPATYTGIFTLIREWMAALPEAKARGYTPGRFSFNVKGGRCESCKGAGVIKVEMHFLPDVYVQCEVCKGLRYNRETLAVTFKGKTISDILAMTVDEALEFFQAIPAIKNRLEILRRIGLGYIQLGQQATTLSGGEAQRMRLSRELVRKMTGKTLYILDEPTTGLHFADIERLLQVIHELVNAGNTVIVIEHNLDVIKNADWIIDIGPEGGSAGGEIIAQGTPETIATKPESFTGHYLKPYLNNQL